MPLYPDLSNMQIFSQAGVAMCQYGINSPVSGLPLGPTGVIAAGSGRGLGRYIAIKQANAQNPEPVVTTVTGDNHRFKHAYVFDPADIGNMDMSFGAFNMAAYAAFTGTQVDSVADSAAVGVGTNAPTNSKQATILLTMDAQDADSPSVFGAPRFVTWFYPAVTVYFVGSQAQEVQGADWQFRGVPTQSGHYPWGTPFSLITNGFTRAKSAPLTSHFPMTLHSYIVSGVQANVTFTLDVSPTTDQTGPAIKAFRYIAATGVVEAATITSVVIATRQVTVAPLSGSFADGDTVYVLFESFDVLAAS